MRENARGLTDRVHGVRGELEDAVEHQVAALEEDIAPIQAVILHDIMRFCLNPEVKRDEGYPSYPPAWL